jgi:nucleoside-diphosphate-sugar epimerase
MNILILGGTGNISRQIVPVLLEQGHEVAVYNRGQREAELPDGVRRISGDRFDRPAFESQMAGERFDVVIDMICFTAEDAASTLRAFAGRTGQMVFTSSVACYQRPSKVLPPFKEDEIEYCNDPAHAYGHKKALMEKHIIVEAPKQKGLSWSIIRPALTFGRGGANFGIFRQNFGLVQRIRAGKPVVIFGDGQVPMSFSFTPDVARGYAALIGNPKSDGQIYHLNSMEYLTWDIFYQTLGKVIGTAPQIIHIPTDLLYAADPVMNGHLFFEKQYVNLFDSSKAARDLGFAPRFTLESGIRWLVEGWESGQAPEIKAEVDKFEDELAELYRQWERQVTGKMN